MADGLQDGGRVLALTILYHPEVSRIGERAELLGPAHELSRIVPEFAGRPLEDRFISRAPVRITTVNDTVTLDAASARCKANGRLLAGTIAAAWQKVDRAALERGVVLELAERVVLLLHLVDAGVERCAVHGLVGGSDAIERVRADITRLATLDVPVLVRGEPGTGKQLVARAIHDAAAPAAERPFVTAAAATATASELPGLLARAGGGTLVLADIDELPADVEPMLQRALATATCRVIAATSAPATQVPQFHELVVPALRDRRDDLGRLLIHFLRAELAPTELARLDRQRDDQRLWLPAALIGRLARYSWPGNVTQLEAAAHALATASSGADEACTDALERLLAPAEGNPASDTVPDG